MARNGDDDTMPLDAVITIHADELLDVPDVVGVGAGLIEGRPVIEVIADADPDVMRARLPSELDGYPLHITKRGRITRLEAGPGGR